MPRLRWILFVALATLLSTGDAASAFKSVKGPASRLLRSDINTPEPNRIDEERSALFGNLKKSARGMKLRYENSRASKFWKKMGKMYEDGATPQKLGELYGPKKGKLQEDFAMYYRWKQLHP
ncbi:hypothetical protein PR001_g27437 [Phytophthora rubi]|uniref:RxLR effector protein n=1 Tax=Phytophthora rubi TaxID=129364 RepID=A0A6A3HHI3_9STRA|nr:hypothetical protein PR002_g27496 [Phytophthora rubi]KAE8969636.1 hypothetical protein PR001_g27437 [Phytophthora rubi]